MQRSTLQSRRLLYTSHVRLINLCAAALAKSGCTEQALVGGRRAQSPPLCPQLKACNHAFAQLFLTMLWCCGIDGVAGVRTCHCPTSTGGASAMWWASYQGPRSLAVWNPTWRGCWRSSSSMDPQVRYLRASSSFGPSPQTDCECMHAFGKASNGVEQLVHVHVRLMLLNASMVMMDQDGPGWMHRTSCRSCCLLLR